MKAIKYVSAGVALAAISMLGIAQDQAPMSFFRDQRRVRRRRQPGRA